MFRPLDFLNLAREILKDEEAYTRTSISRAYYACFLEARERLNITGKVPRIHKSVIDTLYSTDPFSANLLHRMRRWRNIADYDLMGKVKLEDGIGVIRMAERFLSSLR